MPALGSSVHGRHTASETRAASASDRGRTVARAVLVAAALPVLCSVHATERVPPDPPPTVPLAPIEALWAGCAEVLVGPVCGYEPGPDTTLRMWVDVLPSTPIEITLDGEPLAFDDLREDGGARLRVRLPHAGTKLELTIADPRTPQRFTLAMNPEPAKMPPEVAELLAGEDKAEVRRKLAALIPRLEGEARFFAAFEACKLAFAANDVDAGIDALAVAYEIAKTIGRYGDAADLAQQAAYAHLTFRYDLDAAEWWLDLSGSVVVDAERRMGQQYVGALALEQEGRLSDAIEKLRGVRLPGRRLGSASILASALAREAALTGRLGALEAARPLFDEAMALEDELPQTDRAQLTTSIAWLLLDARGHGVDIGDPTPLLESSLVSLTHTNPVALATRAATHLDLAYAAVLAGNPEEAQRWADASPASALTHENRLWQRLIRARVAAIRSDFESARALLLPLANDARAHYRLDFEYEATVGLADVALAEGDKSSALDLYREADGIVDSWLSRLDLFSGRERFMGRQSRAAERMVELLLTVGEVGNALCVARKARTRILETIAREVRFRKLASPAHRNAIAQFRRERARIEAELAESWALPSEEGEKIRQELEIARKANDASLELALAAFFAKDPSDASPRCEGFPSPGPGEIDLHYAVAPHGWNLFIATATGVSAHRVHAGDIAARLVGTHGEPTESAGAVLLGPVQPLLADATRVRIVAEGRLGGVPFHGLLLPRGDGGTLLDAVPVVYGLDLASGEPPPLGGHDRQPAVVVQPTSNLAHAPREAEIARDAFVERGQSVVPLIGDEATGAAVREAIAGAEILHYVGHARADGISGWDSALELALGSSLDVADVLSSTSVPRIVVLDGCETGVSDPQAVGGGMSLAHAFLLAGARVVVATTQPVDDAAAAALLAEFYAAWPSSPGDEIDAAAAMRTAALARREHDDAWLHTRVWVP